MRNIDFNIWISISNLSFSAHPSREPRPDPASDIFRQKYELLSEAIPFILCRHASQRVLPTGNTVAASAQASKGSYKVKSLSPKRKNENSTPNLIHASLQLETPLSEWDFLFFSVHQHSVSVSFLQRTPLTCVLHEKHSRYSGAGLGCSNQQKPSSK